MGNKLCLFLLLMHSSMHLYLFTQICSINYCIQDVHTDLRWIFRVLLFPFKARRVKLDSKRTIFIHGGNCWIKMNINGILNMIYTQEWSILYKWTSIKVKQVQVHVMIELEFTLNQYAISKTLLSILARG